MHYQNQDNEYGEYALCLMPWPCPSALPSVSHTHQAEGDRS